MGDYRLTGLKNKRPMTVDFARSDGVGVYLYSWLIEEEVSRPPRIEFSCAVHHGVSRGHRREEISGLTEIDGSSGAFSPPKL